MEEDDSQTPSLDIVYDLEYEVWKATVLKTGLELDVFSLVARGYRTLSGIAAISGCSERGLRILLDALCSLSLLGKNGDEYLLTPVSASYLVRGRPAYYGDFTLRTQLAWDVRARAAEAVRTGIAVGGDFAGPDAANVWASGSATALLNWRDRAARARQMWETLDVSTTSRAGMHLLDVACGPGVKSFVLAQADPSVRVTALDFPQVLGVAARVAEEMGVTSQVSFMPADLHLAALGSEQFDIILFGRILYYFNPDQRADKLGRAFQALKAGGLLVINEAIADEARCQSESALMAAFQLFLFAPDSQVYTFSQYCELLAGIGYVEVKQHNDELMSAHKPDS